MRTIPRVISMIDIKSTINTPRTVEIRQTTQTKEIALTSCINSPRNFTLVRSQATAILFFSLSFFLLSMGCQAPSQTHQSKKVPHFEQPEIPQYEKPQIKTAQWITLQDNGFDFSYNPKVDILFVMDNSGSMKQIQKNVANNINQFVHYFVQNPVIDFHVAVTVNWDHHTEKFLATHTEGPGALKPIPGLHRRFLKRDDPNLVPKLKQILEVGTLSLKDGGPEHEAFFSPIVGALEKSQKNQVNEGFIRPEAHLVVIMITDADDMTQNLSPREAAALVSATKSNPQQVSVYGVLVSKNDSDSVKDTGLKKAPKYHPHCFMKKGTLWVDNGLCPPSFGPERLEQFIVASNAYLGGADTIKENRIFSIVSRNFGQDLAKMGEDIVKTVLSEKRIPLPYRPQMDDQGHFQISVKFGSEKNKKEVPASAYQYLPQTNELRIPKPWTQTLNPSDRFEIKMLPLLYGTEGEDGGL
jgi:hypothetical protein